METKTDIILFNIIRVFFALIGMAIVGMGAYTFITLRFFPEEVYQSYYLGDRFYRLGEGHQKSIMYATSEIFEVVGSGNILIPPRWFEDSIFPAEYVDTYRFDEDYIIARTASTEVEGNRFYYIEKSDLKNGQPGWELDSVVHEFTDSAAFINVCEAKGIKLRLSPQRENWVGRGVAMDCPEKIPMALRPQCIAALQGGIGRRCCRAT